MAADRAAGGGNRARRVAGWLLFAAYVAVLLYFLFFSEKMGRIDGGCAYRYNLMPLREIRRFLTHWEVLGTEAVLLNVVGNVLAFVPFGIFLPLLVAPCRSWWRTMLCGLGLSLAAEILQLLTKVGSFDVDDLILNALGALAGFLVFLIGYRIWKKRRGR